MIWLHAVKTYTDLLNLAKHLGLAVSIKKYIFATYALDWIGHSNSTRSMHINLPQAIPHGILKECRLCQIGSLVTKKGTT